MREINLQKYEQFVCSLDKVAGDNKLFLSPGGKVGPLALKRNIKPENFKTSQIVEIAQRAIEEVDASKELLPKRREEFFNNLEQALKNYRKNRLIPAFRRRWWCKILYFFRYRPRAIQEVRRAEKSAADSLKRAIEQRDSIEQKCAKEAEARREREEKLFQAVSSIRDRFNKVVIKFHGAAKDIEDRYFPTTIRDKNDVQQALQAYSLLMIRYDIAQTKLADMQGEIDELSENFPNGLRVARILRKRKEELAKGVNKRLDESFKKFKERLSLPKTREVAWSTVFAKLKYSLEDLRKKAAGNQQLLEYISRIEQAQQREAPHLILGFESPPKNQEELARLFRRCALQVYPDKNPDHKDVASEIFIICSAAKDWIERNSTWTEKVE
jgi:hypothetical protein